MGMRTEPEQIILNRLKLILTGGCFAKKWNKQQQNSKQRFYILKQWVSSEQSYIRNLKIIQNRIQKPLIEAKLITDQEQRILFANLKAIIELSNNISGCIQEIIKEWNPLTTKIGEKVIHFYKFFMIYREYLSNYTKGQQILRKINSTPEVHIFDNFDHQNFRITPAQRLPKYQLLLKQYYKSLSKKHIDYALVGQAVQKYRSIVQLNNSCMDRQIRDDLMINLDRKYGGIISDRMGREFIRQFMCKYTGLKCQIFAFNNMILLVNQQNQEQQQIFKRLNLNGTSFVLQKNHLKHYKNIVYVCGAYQSAHLEFSTQADASYFYEEVDRLIKQLYQDQKERLARYNQNQTKKKNLSKLKVSKFHEENVFKGYSNPKLQITVNGTVRRKDQPMYYVCFKVIYPYNSSQTLLLSMEQILKVYYFLQSSYKDIHFPKIDEKPDYIGFMEASKNKTRVIEYRSFAIQVFLNYIYRNQMLQMTWKIVAKELGLNSALLEFATSEQFTCNCQLCLEMKENQSVQTCQFLLNTIKKCKKYVKSRYTWQPISESQWRTSFYSQAAGQVAIYKPDCIFYLFEIMQNVYNASKQNIVIFNQRMLSLQAEMGNLRYNLLKEERINLQKIVKLKIHYSMMEDKFLQTTLTEDRYCREIIQQFAHKNNIETAFDWGLFLEEDGQLVQIGKDQKILQFAKKWGVQLQQIEQKVQDDTFSFNRMFGDIRKWGEQLIGVKKSRLYIKKYLYFDPVLQFQQCKSSKQRCYLILNQQFKRFKNNQLYLDQNQIVTMCSCYLLTTQFDQIKRSLQKIQMQKIKDILPERLYPLITDDIFSLQIIKQVKINHNKLIACQNQTKALEWVYTNILQSLHTNRQWITQYFPLTSYSGATENDILLGISYDRLTILKSQDRKILLSIQLQKLQYKITTSSIFVHEGNEDYRYDSNNIWKLKQIIDIYLAYCKFFLK